MAQSLVNERRLDEALGKLLAIPEEARGVEANFAIGRVYALNTLGNVAGALLPGLVLLHWFGVQRGILVMAGLNASVGFVILLTRPVRPATLRWAAPAFVVGVALLNAAVVETVRILLERGIEPPVFRSANLDHSDEHNQRLMKRYAGRLTYL